MSAFFLRALLSMILVVLPTIVALPFTGHYYAATSSINAATIRSADASPALSMSAEIA